MAEYSTQTSSTPQVSYLTTDHLGSTRLVTDQLGAVKDRKDFGAFGDETATPARVVGLGYNTADPTRKGYTGYEKDAESSLEFAQARYYSTTHGRYTSVDPLTASVSIKNPQTFNRYAYVLNSPYKYTDPLGLVEECRTCSVFNMTTQSMDKAQAEQEERRKKELEEKRKKKQQPTDPPPPPVPTAEQNAEPQTESEDDVVNESDEQRQRYNCMAWALGFTDVWIEPIYYEGGARGGGFSETRNRNAEGKGDDTFLPFGEQGVNDLPPFSMVQTAKAYDAKQDVKVGEQKTKASSASIIPDGYYKLVVFEGRNYRQTHVMRQDADGTWSSKNGSGARATGIKDPEAYYRARYSPGIDVKSTYLFRKTEKLGRR